MWLSRHFRSEHNFCLVFVFYKNNSSLLECVHIRNTWAVEVMCKSRVFQVKLLAILPIKGQVGLLYW